MAEKRKRGRRIPKMVFETHAALRFAIRQFQRHVETSARQAGLTPQQYRTLLAIEGFPGRDRVTLAELAERLQLRHNSAVGLADRLGRKGLVVRARSSTDRRLVFVSLTTRGIRLLQRVSAANRNDLQRLRQQLMRLLLLWKDGAGALIEESPDRG